MLWLGDSAVLFDGIAQPSAGNRASLTVSPKCVLPRYHCNLPGEDHTDCRKKISLRGGGHLAWWLPPFYSICPPGLSASQYSTVDGANDNACHPATVRAFPRQALSPVFPNRRRCVSVFHFDSGNVTCLHNCTRLRFCPAETFGESQLA